MPITMHAVGWRVVASAALDEAAAGDEAVAIVRVGCRAVGWGASAAAAMAARSDVGEAGPADAELRI